MQKPPHAIEIFLQPGELWFGDRDTRVRTILGSCIAATLWHPGLRVGGMCHYMLAARAGARGSQPDGRYGDEALDVLTAHVRATGRPAREFEAKLFGGGNMFHPTVREGGGAALRVSDANVVAGRSLLQRHGFQIKAEHVGGHGHREVFLDLWSGNAWVRHSVPNVRRQSAAAGDFEKRASL